MHDTHQKFSSEAPGQAAGYNYQLRYALFKALKRSRRDPTGRIALERLDDISIDAAGELLEVSQLKHTVQDEGSFGDNSPSIWRTLSNWAKLISSETVDVSRINFVLVTNATIAEGSALAKLGPAEDRRDPIEATKSLSSAAQTSKNKKTATDRATFLSLEAGVRLALMRAVTIVADAPGLQALGEEIEDILHYACQTECLSDFRAELEGWWFDRVSASFDQGIGPVLSLLALDERVSYLREKYRRRSLNIDIDDIALTDPSIRNEPFLEQVRLLKVSERRLLNTQRDYLKASAQRSKWLRETRIDPADLNRYDASLEESWSTQFAIIHDELEPGATDEDKCKSGRQLLGWAETQQVPLRGAAAQFLTSGSYHALSNQVVIGWHPDFAEYFKNK